MPTFQGGVRPHFSQELPSIFWLSRHTWVVSIPTTYGSLTPTCTRLSPSRIAPACSSTKRPGFSNTRYHALQSSLTSPTARSKSVTRCPLNANSSLNSSSTARTNTRSCPNIASSSANKINTWLISSLLWGILTSDCLLLGFSRKLTLTDDNPPVQISQTSDVGFSPWPSRVACGGLNTVRSNLSELG